MRACSLERHPQRTNHALGRGNRPHGLPQAFHFANGNTRDRLGPGELRARRPARHANRHDGTITVIASYMGKGQFAQRPGGKSDGSSGSPTRPSISGTRRPFAKPELTTNVLAPTPPRARSRVVLDTSQSQRASLLARRAPPYVVECASPRKIHSSTWSMAPWAGDGACDRRGAGTPDGFAATSTATSGAGGAWDGGARRRARLLARGEPLGHIHLPSAAPTSASAA